MSNNQTFLDHLEEMHGQPPDDLRRLAEAIESYLDAYVPDQDELDKTADALGQRINEMEGRLNKPLGQAVNKSVEVENEIAEIHDSLDDRLDDLEERLDELENESDSESLLATHDSIRALDQKIKALEKRLDAAPEDGPVPSNELADFYEMYNNELDDLRDRVDQNRKGIDAYYERFQKQADRLDQLEERLHATDHDTLESAVAELAGHLDDVVKGMDLQDSYMNELRERVADIDKGTTSRLNNLREELNRVQCDLAGTAKDLQDLRNRDETLADRIDEVEQKADDTDELIGDLLEGLDHVGIRPLSYSPAEDDAAWTVTKAFREDVQTGGEIYTSLDQRKRDQTTLREKYNRAKDRRDFELDAPFGPGSPEHFIREVYPDAEISGFSQSGHPDHSFPGFRVRIGGATYRVSRELFVAEEVEEAPFLRCTPDALDVENKLMEELMRQAGENEQWATPHPEGEDVGGSIQGDKAPKTGDTTAGDRTVTNETGLKALVQYAFPMAEVERRESDLQPGVDVTLRGDDFFVMTDLSVAAIVDDQPWKLSHTTASFILEKALVFTFDRVMEHGGPDPLPDEEELRRLDGMTGE